MPSKISARGFKPRTVLQRQQLDAAQKKSAEKRRKHLAQLNSVTGQINSLSKDFKESLKRDVASSKAESPAAAKWSYTTLQTFNALVRAKRQSKLLLHPQSGKKEEMVKETHAWIHNVARKALERRALMGGAKADAEAEAKRRAEEYKKSVAEREKALLAREKKFAQGTKDWPKEAWQQYFHENPPTKKAEYDHLKKKWVIKQEEPEPEAEEPEEKPVKKTKAPKRERVDDSDDSAEESWGEEGERL